MSPPQANPHLLVCKKNIAPMQNLKDKRFRSVYEKYV